MNFVSDLIFSCFLCIYGVWWMIMTTNDYLMSKFVDTSTRRKPPFMAKTWFRFPVERLYKYPIEPVSKLILCCLGAAIDLSISNSWRLLDEKGSVVVSKVASYSRATMLLMFALVGFAELAETVKKFKFPRSTSFITLSVAFLSMGIFYLFNTPEEKFNPIASKFHLFLCSTSFVAFFVTLFETWNTKSFPISFCRCFLTVLQGTWLFQMAFAVNGQNAWLKSKGNLAVIPVIFIWHILVLFICSMLLHCIVSCAVNHNRNAKDRIYDNGQFNHRNEDSIPLGIVVNGKAIYDASSSDDDTLYP